MKKVFIVLSVIWCISFFGQMQNGEVRSLTKKSDQSFFIENKGQWPEEVAFLARLGGCNAWITKDGMVLDFFNMNRSEDVNFEQDVLTDKYDFDEEKFRIQGHVIRFKFIGTNDNVKAEGIYKKSGCYNYFVGNDAKKWATNVSLFGEVLMKDLYPGVDVRYYFDRGFLRFDIFLAPGLSPDMVKWKIDGTDEVLLENNELKFLTRFGWVKLMDLHAFQGNRELESAFLRKENYWTFFVRDYDLSERLVIDPTVYSTFLGGTDFDESYSIISVPGGNALITGYTLSTNFPTVVGSYDTSFNAQVDIFISKLNHNLSDLMFSTFIGGSDDDVGSSIKVVTTCNNCIYLTGWTKSADFPIKGVSYDATFNGGEDVFVLRLSNNGDSIIFSTYLGGSGDERGISLALDDAADAYVTGWTNSANFPVVNAFDSTYNGEKDIFVFKLSPANSLLYSTFIGGAYSEVGNSIVIDSVHCAYITGWTNSANFATSSNSIGSSINHAADVILLKLNDAGNNLEYSLLFGGSADDVGNSIDLDENLTAYITGWTQSADFPVTLNAFDDTLNGSRDAFLTVINIPHNDMFFSTFWGGSGVDAGSSLALDEYNRICLTGWTYSDDFPITNGAYDTSYHGNGDAFYSKINTWGLSIPYSTYLGGEQFDRGYSIDYRANYVYLTGSTESFDYPVVEYCYDTSYNENRDAFVMKIGSGAGPCIFVLDSLNVIEVCVNDTMTPLYFGTFGITSVYVYGLPPGVNWAYYNGFVTLYGVPTLPGVYNFFIITSGGAFAYGKIFVRPAPGFVVEVFPDTLCAGEQVVLTATGAEFYIFDSIPWDGDTLYVTPFQSTTYTVTGFNSYGCSSELQVTVNVNPLPDVVATAVPDTICLGRQTRLTATGADIYIWDHGLGEGPIHNDTPSVTTTYTVTGIDTNGCSNTAQVTVVVFDKPQGSVTSNAPLCAGSQLELIASGGENYIWAGPNEFYWSDPSVIIGNAQASQSGTYTVTISTGPDCDTVISVDVWIYDPPEITFLMKEERCNRKDGRIETTLISGNLPVTYNWSNGCDSTILEGIPAGIYVVTVTDVHGCFVIDSVEVKSDTVGCEFFVEIPTAFSPNGDGLNDLLMIAGRGIEKMSFVIFNRWGNKIFESNGFGEYWDGTYKGIAQDAGVYVYKLEGKFRNGEWFVKTGEITLIR